MLAVSLEPETIGKTLADHQQQLEDEDEEEQEEEEGDGSESASKVPQQLDNDDHEPPLKKQNSILSLTLDEIQFKSGRSFGSMNMEDFIANIWSVDQENYECCPIVTLDDHNNYNNNNHTGVARQGSFSIPIPICKKTVDQIWVELQRGSGTEGSAEAAPAIRQQQTLGEMTLEDFLVKAGVYQECSTTTTTTATTTNSTNNVTAFFRHNNNESVNGKMKKKRIAEGLPELAVERRQRRMIKNRESAARSRARKQAYTVELEVELNQLKAENEKLKQVMGEAELKRKQEILRRSQNNASKAQQLTQRLRTIRRVGSLGW